VDCKPVTSLKAVLSSTHRATLNDAQKASLLAKSHVHVNAAKQHYTPWFATMPTTTYTKLDDREFATAILMHCDMLPPSAVRCADNQLDLSTLSPHDYQEHIFGCVKCSSCLFYHRHERINCVLHQTLRYHGCCSTINPKHYPLPGNDRGGPDLVVQADRTYLIDVSVAKPPSATATRTEPTKARFLEKKRKYERAATAYNATIVPFIMSSHCVFNADSLKLLTEITRHAGPDFLFANFTAVRREAIAHTQFALIKSTVEGLTSVVDRLRTPVV
jgi:hypothetical protein